MAERYDSAIRSANFTSVKAGNKMIDRSLRIKALKARATASLNRNAGRIARMQKLQVRNFKVIERYNRKRGLPSGVRFR